MRRRILIHTTAGDIITVRREYRRRAGKRAARRSVFVYRVVESKTRPKGSIYTTARFKQRIPLSTHERIVAEKSFKIKQKETKAKYIRTSQLRHIEIVHSDTPIPYKRLNIGAIFRVHYFLNKTMHYTDIEAYSRRSVSSSEVTESVVESLLRDAEMRACAIFSANTSLPTSSITDIEIISGVIYRHFRQRVD